MGLLHDPVTRQVMSPNARCFTLRRPMRCRRMQPLVRQTTSGLPHVDSDPTWAWTPVMRQSPMGFGTGARNGRRDLLGPDLVGLDLMRPERGSSVEATVMPCFVSG